MSVLNGIKKSLDSLVQRYKVEQKQKKKYKNISLGRIFSLGQYYPFTLAENLFQNKKEYLVLVDHHIKAGRKSFYPDLLVIKESEVAALIEVKIDLGWVKDIAKVIKNFNLNFYRAIKYKNGEIEHRVKVGKNLRKMFFLVTRANDHKRYDIVKARLEKNGVEVIHCLENQHHPNNTNFDNKWIEGDLKNNSKMILKAFNWLK